MTIKTPERTYPLTVNGETWTVTLAYGIETPHETVDELVMEAGWALYATSPDGTVHENEDSWESSPGLQFAWDEATESLLERYHRDLVALNNFTNVQQFDESYERLVELAQSAGRSFIDGLKRRQEDWYSAPTDEEMWWYAMQAATFGRMAVEKRDA